MSDTARRPATDPASPATILRDSAGHVGSRQVRRRARPHGADVRGRDRAPDRGDRARWPSHRGAAAQRGRPRRAARHLEADAPPGAPRARAVRPRRGAAREVGRDLRRHRPRAVGRDLHRRQARGGGRDRRSPRAPRAGAGGRAGGDARRDARRSRRAGADRRAARSASRRAAERDARRRDVPPGARPQLPERDDPGCHARRRARPRADPGRLQRWHLL